jgi:hypothetical protein
VNKFSHSVLVNKFSHVESADEEHKRRFDVALGTLFWVAAGMGLPGTLPPQYTDGTPNYGVFLYFSSFILVLNWTLLQVGYVAAVTVFTVDPRIRTPRCNISYMRVCL